MRINRNVILFEQSILRVRNVILASPDFEKSENFFGE